MSAIPPKQTPDTLAYEHEPSEPGETGGGLVAMYNAASHANAESFPVLKAFQDYIEAERAQARKRVVQLSVLFAVLMTVVVGGFLTAGIAMWRSNDQRVDKLLEAVIAQKSAPVQAPAPAAVVHALPVLEDSAKQLSRATTELQASVDKKLDSVSEIASKVNEKVASQDSELEKLRAELRLMQDQSSKLKDELVTIKEDSKKPQAVAVVPVQAATPPPAVAATLPLKPNVPAAPAKPVVDPRFPAAVKAPPVTPPGVKPPPVPSGMMATAIPLKTLNVGTIPWRVLIPE